MSEEVLFETESMQSRDEIADYLRRVADSLEEGREITLRAGDQSVSLSPADRCEFEVKAEREGADGDGELSVEFELEWGENADGADGTLEIE